MARSCFGQITGAEQRTGPRPSCNQEQSWSKRHHKPKTPTTTERYGSQTRRPLASSFDEMDKMTTRSKNGAKRRCGLCGKTRNLIRAECCGNWICNDEHKYVLFSYARNSCYRNHRRMTLCGFHHAERHPGRWTDCKLCRQSFMTEMYVWYGTNEYNFEKLQNPPAYEPTLCSACGRVIALDDGGYAQLGEQFWCERCHDRKMRKKMASKPSERTR